MEALLIALRYLWQKAKPDIDELTMIGGGCLFGVVQGIVIFAFGAVLLGVLVSPIVFWLGASAPRTEMANCPAPVLQSDTQRGMAVVVALAYVQQMQEQAPEMYGFWPRVRHRSASITVTAVERLASVGVDIPTPSIYRRQSDQLFQRIIEAELIRQSALAFGETVCTTQTLVPDAGVDSVSEATRKLWLLDFALKQRLY